MIKDIIELAKNLGNRYDNNIYAIIADFNYRIVKSNVLNITTAYTIKLDDINYIVVNNNIDKHNLDFILAHEFYHCLKHDNKYIRHFSKLALATNKLELQANLFATIFLGYTYRDCNNDDYIQKIINYIYCNYTYLDIIKTI